MLKHMSTNAVHLFRGFGEIARLEDIESGFKRDSRVFTVTQTLSHWPITPTDHDHRGLPVSRYV